MMVKVLEIPSCASLNGSLDTEDKECYRTVGVTSVHRVSAGCERLAFLTSVRCVTGSLTVSYVGSNGKDGSGRNTVSVGVMSSDCGHELVNDHPVQSHLRGRRHCRISGIRRLVLKSTMMPSSSRTTSTLAYLIAERSQLRWKDLQHLLQNNA